MVNTFILSLREMAEIRIPAETATARPIIIDVGGVTVTIN